MKTLNHCSNCVSCTAVPPNIDFLLMFEFLWPWWLHLCSCKKQALFQFILKKKRKLFFAPILFSVKKNLPDRVCFDMFSLYELSTGWLSVNSVASKWREANRHLWATLWNFCLFFLIQEVNYKLILFSDDSPAWVIMDYYNVATLKARHLNTSCSSRTSLPAVYKHPHVYSQILFSLHVGMWVLA